jgi:hypothetical protein
LQEKLNVRAGRQGDRGLFLSIFLEAIIWKGVRIPQVSRKWIVGQRTWAPWWVHILVVVIGVVLGVLWGLPVSGKFGEHWSMPLDPEKFFGFGRPIESDSWVLVLQKSLHPDGKEVIPDLY